MADTQPSPDFIPPAALPATLWQRFKRRLERWWRKWNTYVYIGGFVFLFFVVYLAPRIFIPIDAGQSGVLFRRFWGGTMMNRIYGEGLAIIPPWDTMTVYNMRLQTVDDHFEVLAGDGLKLTVTMSIRYRPVAENLPTLHKEVGPDYFNKIVRPGVESVVRIILGQYQPEEIYTSKKFVIQNAVQGALNEVGERYVQLDDLLITDIELPLVVSDAVEQKLKQQQISEEFDFRVAREEKEAERKRIEAQGIHDFQSIVTQGLNENFLRYEGIKASLELAQSPNAKVLIFGNRDGLPVILDATSRGGDADARLNVPVPLAREEKKPEAVPPAPLKEKRSATLDTPVEAAGIVPPPPEAKKPAAPARP